MPSIDQGLLERLSAKIESAWEERRDYRLVHQLAAEHPQLSEDLYEFFALLSTAEDAEVPPAIAQRAVARTREWLEGGAYGQIVEETRAERRRNPTPSSSPSTSTTPSRAGSDAAGPEQVAQRPSPRSLIAFLQRRTGQSPSQIAAEMPHANVELLTLVGRYPQPVNPAVRRTIAETAEAVWRIPKQDTLAEFDSPMELPRAASRRGAYGAPPSSFAELLRRTGLSKADQRYWLRVAEEGE